MFRQDDRKGCRCWIRCKTDSIWLGDSDRGIKARGITNMMDRLSNPGKIRAFELAETLKDLMRPLYEKHMDDIMTGAFSSGMMDDWADDDAKLLGGDKKRVRLLSKLLTRASRQISPSRLILILAF